MNYMTAVQEAEAAVNQIREQIRRLQEQYRLDQRRLQTLNRNRKLVQAEYERRKTLFQKDMVSRSSVEQAEQAANLERCTVQALFQARVKSVQLEKGQSWKLFSPLLFYVLPDD